MVTSCKVFTAPPALRNHPYICITHARSLLVGIVSMIIGDLKVYQELLKPQILVISTEY